MIQKLVKPLKTATTNERKKYYDFFAHEELSHEEACNLMKGITRGDYNEAQIVTALPYSRCVE